MKEDEFNNETENIITVGKILKKQRKDILNKTLADISAILKYRNYNFISMIESGRSNPPLARINDLCKAYELEPHFALIIMKVYYQDTWSAFKNMIRENKDIFGINIDLDDKVNVIFQKYIKDYINPAT